MSLVKPKKSGPEPTIAEFGIPPDSLKQVWPNNDQANRTLMVIYQDPARFQKLLDATKSLPDRYEKAVENRIQKEALLLEEQNHGYDDDLLQISDRSKYNHTCRLNERKQNQLNALEKIVTEFDRKNL